MAEIHKLIVQNGKQAALSLASEDIVNIAAGVLGDERGDLGYTYSGLCLTALPHRKIPDDQLWERQGHRVKLVVEPGRLQVGNQLRLYGVPYGARARMILIYLITQAVRTDSREIALGRSMRAWLEAMGVTVGGETAKAFREQSMRIAACSMRFFWETEKGANGFEKGGIVRRGLLFGDSIDIGPQPRLFDDTVVLDEVFFRAAKEHPVPLLETAVRHLRDRSMSLDIYVWLAYRLHVLDRPTPVTWTALHSQFGGGFKEARFFRRPFLEALEAATAAYPDARVELADDGSGLILHPSRPPVGKLLGA
ncbi:replication protein RepA [Azospirillum thermophilum]|uniref:Pirin n=1 Tax=Azospirillum thermophilum TaxID=2202148 RepID=A0A2S2D0M2_9PROT|nr:replication protein RepA [Azospirillum thermophilum]AWK90313.1 pirin [Azospirillum thermophilum]